MLFVSCIPTHWSRRWFMMSYPKSSSFAARLNVFDPSAIVLLWCGKSPLHFPPIQTINHFVSIYCKASYLPLSFSNPLLSSLRGPPTRVCYTTCYFFTEEFDTLLIKSCFFLFTSCTLLRALRSLTYSLPGKGAPQACLVCEYLRSKSLGY